MGKRQSKSRFRQDGIIPNRLASEPTQAQPGSHAKLAVMIARVENGEWPLHPGDRKAKDGDYLPLKESLLWVNERHLWAQRGARKKKA